MAADGLRGETTFSDEGFRREVRNRLIRHQRWVEGHADGVQAELKNLDLYGWRLPGLVIPKADLRATCLVKADLRGADLTGASLMLADLEDCDLTDAILIGADLRGARLNGAKLMGARMDGVDLGPVSLRGPLQTSRRSLEQGGHISLMKEVDARGAV
ncbi:MAG: pentapeptide repeat-containing protein, partial [Pseudomonadota bacterium]